MKLVEIEALADGLAPVIRDLMAAAIKPLADENAALKRQVEELLAVDHAAVVADLVADAIGKLPPALAGKDADPADIARLVNEAVAALPVPSPGEPGKDADPDLIAALVDEKLSAAVTALTPPENGKDADPAVIIASLVAQAVAALPPAAQGEPGKDADPDAITALVEEKVSAAVAALPPAENGKDADPAVIAELVAAAVAELPPAAAGRDADPAVIRQMVDEAVSALPRPAPGEPGQPGKDGALPIVKAYEEGGVHYAGAVVTHGGATWQASKDTGRAPPHEDWTCIARAGRDGEPGKSFHVRGTHADETEYLALDVVALNGASFVAKYDNPGTCPGEGWQIIAMQGKRGAPGENSRVPGANGSPGPAVTALEISDEGMLTLRNADGTIAQCDLYPLLSRIS